MGRDLYMATSSDEGALTGVNPWKLDVDILGNCRCCPIQATIDAKGVLHVVQRNSVKTSASSWDKDTYWLSSADQGHTWSKQLVQKWENCGCPGGTLLDGPRAERRRVWIPDPGSGVLRPYPQSNGQCRGTGFGQRHQPARGGS